jgi:hypothetical protein
MYKVPLYFIKHIIDTLTTIEKALLGELKTTQKLSLLKKVKTLNKKLKVFIDVDTE